MDSQTFGTLAAAVITAGTGFVAASVARRTSYRRKQLQSMHDEAELLALLPEDHPMRPELSRVIEVRLRGYTRLFDYSLSREGNPAVPGIAAAIGLAMVMVSVVFDNQIGTSGYLWGLFTGNLDWSESHTKELIGVLLLVLGFMFYIMGFLAIPQWKRARTWTRAMRGDEIAPPRAKPALEVEASTPKVRRSREGRARLKKG